MKKGNNKSNINEKIGSEWYPNKKKEMNKKADFYLADSCDLSRNIHLTKKSLKNQNVHGNIDTFLPVSGSEPHYNPKKWNDDIEDRYNHNCYAYFLDDLIHKRSKRPQPGHVDPNMNVFRKQDYTREEISRRAVYDNPSIYCTHPEDKCEKGYYKGALVIDRYNNYHWLIQNSNGYWSHKPGQLPVTNTDADKKLIKDPRKANLLYDNSDKGYTLFYSDIGPFFCVPNSKETGIIKRSSTCEQCGGGIRRKNISRICYKCK